MAKACEDAGFDFNINSTKQLGEVLCAPSFPAREVERLKGERLADLLKLPLNTTVKSLVLATDQANERGEIERRLLEIPGVGPARARGFRYESDAMVERPYDVDDHVRAGERDAERIEGGSSKRA